MPSAPRRFAPSRTRRFLQSRRTWLAALRIAAPVLVILVIAILGGRQARDKIAIVKPIEYIGHADEASYALQGKSVAQGRGVRVDYVSTFFLKYPAEITHREDHWPPFMGYSIAPFFYFMGVQTWVARIPGILYGSIGLPLATALLAYALTRRGHVALLAAILMMASPDIYQHSMRTLSDTATAMLVAAFCGSVILGPRHGWMYVAAGICAACAYFSKGSEILLLAMYPILAVLAGGFAVLKSRWFYAGSVAAILLMLPHWYANWRDYGNPLHTTQNYVAAFFGFENWDEQFYAPYWGKNLPQVSDRWTKHDTYRVIGRRQLAAGIGAVLSGALEDRGYSSDQRQVWEDFGERGIAARKWIVGEEALRTERGGRAPSRKKPVAQQVKPIAEWQAPVTQLATLAGAGLLGISLLCAPALAAVAGWRGYCSVRRKRAPLARPTRMKRFAAWTEHHLWTAGPVIGVALVLAMHVVFVAYFWKFEARFLFPVVPLVIALGSAAAWHFVEWPARAMAATLVWMQRRMRGRPFARPLRVRMVMGRRILPGAVTLLVASASLFMTDRIDAWQTQLLQRGGVNDKFPFYSSYDRHIDMGKWISQKLPNAIVMCRGPWELLFYAGPGNKAVGLPCPRDHGQRGAEEIFAIARYYGVTHMYVDSTRPSLAAYLYRGKPGLKRVKDAPDALYELDWNLLPKKTVDELWP